MKKNCKCEKCCCGNSSYGHSCGCENKETHPVIGVDVGAPEGDETVVQKLDLESDK